MAENPPERRFRGRLEMKLISEPSLQSFGGEPVEFCTKLGIELIKPASLCCIASRAHEMNVRSRRRMPPLAGWRFECRGAARQAVTNQSPTVVPRPQRSGNARAR